MLKQNGRLEIENKIKDLLVSELKVNRSVIDASSSITPLLGQGIGLDSVETMALIVAIEEEFEISVPDSDLNAPLFENIDTLAKYVLQKVTETGKRPYAAQAEPAISSEVWCSCPAALRIDGDGNDQRGLECGY